MNASLQSAGRLRGQAQGYRPMRKMPQSAQPGQQKPVFAVLETAANENAAAQAKNNRRSDKGEFERLCTGQTSFAFSFPLEGDFIISDLLEQASHVTAVTGEPSSKSYENVTNVHSLSSGNVTTPHQSATKTVRFDTVRGGLATHNGPRVSRVPLADFVYSLVKSRAIKTFWPNRKKNPNYVLAYVEETLECGHIIDIHPSDSEKLVARKRQCHQCQGFWGGLDFKKVAESVKDARAKRRSAGKTDWSPAIFALGTCLVLVCLLIRHTPKSHLLSAPETYVRVLRQFNTYDFQLQKVVNGVAQQPSVWHFCHDFAPQFEIGFTLTQLKWIDGAGCSEIGPRYIHHAYIIERDKGGLPTVPRNCINTSDEAVFCNGEPKFN